MTDNIIPVTRRMSNLSRLEELLEDPSGEASLDVLKQEMNELAVLRQNTRLAFCKRLALVWMIIVQAVPTQGKRTAEENAKRKQFFLWCGKNLRSATGKQYSSGTLKTYLQTGFASNPAEHYNALMRKDRLRAHKQRKLISGLHKAIETAPRPIPIAVLREKYTSDIAREVNQLMRCWEESSSEARASFIYQVTGRKL